MMTMTMTKGLDAGVNFFYGFLITFGSCSARYRAKADACVLDLFVERATKKCVMSAFFCTFADCHSAEGCMYGS